MNNFQDNYNSELRVSANGGKHQVFEWGYKLWANKDFSKFEIVFTKNKEHEAIALFDLVRRGETAHLSLELNPDPYSILANNGFCYLLVEAHFHPQFLFNKNGIVIRGLNNGSTVSFPIEPSPEDWLRASTNLSVYQGLGFTPTYFIFRGTQMYQYGIDRNGHRYNQMHQWRKD